MDGGAWWATVHRVAKSQTRLRDFTFFTFIKRLFSSSLLSAKRVVSSAHLRLLIFLPAVLILAWVSSSLALSIWALYFSLSPRQESLIGQQGDRASVRYNTSWPLSAVESFNARGQDPSCWPRAVLCLKKQQGEKKKQGLHVQINPGTNPLLSTDELRDCVTVMESYSKTLNEVLFLRFL